MWTLGVDVDLCLWEREPSEEGLEELNVKAWGVEYLCWESSPQTKSSGPRPGRSIQAVILVQSNEK